MPHIDELVKLDFRISFRNKILFILAQCTYQDQDFEEIEPKTVSVQRDKPDKLGRGGHISAS